MFVAGRSGIAAAFVLLGLAASSMPANADGPPVPTLSVVGRAAIAAAPDLAIVDTGVVTAAATAEKALAANSEAMSEVVATIRAAGIEARDIGTNGFSIQPRYSYPAQGDRDPPAVVGYEVRNGVTVKLRDLAGIGSLLDKLTQSGVNQASGLTFLKSDREELEERARLDAARNAIAQAGRLAAASGVRLGRILKIEPVNEGVGFNPRPLAAMAMASAERAVPVESGELEVRAAMLVVYEIETP